MGNGESQLERKRQVYNAQYMVDLLKLKRLYWNLFMDSPPCSRKETYRRCYTSVADQFDMVVAMRKRQFKQIAYK